MNTLSKKNSYMVAVSILLLGFTFIFWLGLVLQKFFEEDTFTYFFVHIDSISPLLSILILFIFPLLAITINALSVLSFKIQFDGEELHVEMNLKKKLFQWAIIVYATVSIGLVLAYLFLENFTEVHVGN